MIFNILGYRGILLLLGITPLLLCVSSPVSAQDRNKEACLNILVERFEVDRERAKAAPCRFLASAIQDRITTSLKESAKETAQKRLSPRDFQIPQGEVGSNAGTPIQGGSAPSIQSVALAGGNLAAAGTEKGMRTFATAVLNPASLFTGPDGGAEGDDSNRKDSLSVALSNLGDVTFIAPVEDIDEEEALDYLGVRARINVTSLVQGAQSFQEVENQWLNVLQLSGKLTGQIQPALLGADSVAVCTDALLQAPEKGIQSANAACNAEFNPIKLSTRDFDRLRDLTEKALAEADDAYFGLNLRFDEGDPTLGVADSARGTRLYAGVGWGRRYGEATSTRTTLRLNGGVKFVDLDATEDAVFAAEGGLDLAFSKTIDKQRLEGSAGLSFSVGDVREAFEAAAETNYLRGRLSVNVPLAKNYGLSINLATPIVGEVGTTLSVKTSTHLLLPGSQ